MKKIIYFLLFVGCSFSINAQSAAELKKEQAPIKAKIAKLKGEVAALQSKIDALPGWRVGAFGTIGGSLSGFKNWYSRTAPNAGAGNIGITINGFANLVKETFFWKNAGSVNLGWVKLDDKSVDGDAGFETATDVFTISSLYGKRINKKWAASALIEYRTSLIDNFNDPGYLDFGGGFTWTPINKLVVVVHPGNYNFVFSKGETVFESSLGAKVVADYARKIKKLSLKSNLSIYQSYKSNDLSNWALTNTLGYTLFKKIGLGFELGLRQNKQEALNNALMTDANAVFKMVANKLQSYWLLGMSYAF
ncbi:DUF3078 domain-containing protein [Polaribacter sp.]|jgi:hypothetical protein|nr:DUF3078 domain-containing protein [Polaribacter sp.]